MDGAVCPAMRTSSPQFCFLTRQWSKAALSWWLRKVARPLEVEHYLLPPRLPQQPGQRPHPQQLPAAPAPAHPVATPSQPSPSAQAPQHAASTSSEMPSLAEEARPEQNAAAFSEFAPVSSSQQGSQVAVRHNHMHQIIAGSKDGEDMVPGMSGAHAPHQADLHSGRSAQPQSPSTMQPSASSHASVISGTGQEGFLPERAHGGGNKLRDMHNSKSRHGLLSESAGGSEGEHSQQVEQASEALSHREDQAEVPSSSWEELQADKCPQAPAQSSAQAGPSTETDAQATADEQGEPPGPAHLLSDSVSRASPAESQSGVASGAGAQAALLGDAHEATATAEGLAANTQLDDSDELSSQLLTVAALLMLTLLLFMTGLLTLPCIIGKPPL